MWISCYELDFKNKTKEDFEKQIDIMFSKCAKAGINSLFVHIRPFSDSFYPSQYFPFSKYIAGKQGINPGYNPLKIMIEKAHSKNLKFHAWINPFRISYQTDINELCETNPAVNMYKNEPGSVAITKSGIYYNPSVESVQKLILNGVKEIIDNYNIDGIHFDDYFYPETSPEFDKITYQSYRENAKHPLSLQEYRKASVNALISSVYSVIKQKNKDILFGISPQAKIDYNEKTLYADVVKWCENKGYIDYIAPQLYFGFEYDNEKQNSVNFDYLVKCWQNIDYDSSVKLCVGLPLYKSGTEEAQASRNKKEWLENSDIITKQLELAEKSANYGGVILFSYSSFDSNNNQKSEMKSFSRYLNPLQK